MRTADTEQRVVVRHTVDLSPDQAFDSWLISDIVETWWGPEGYRTSVETLNAFVGGQFRFRMTAPSGTSCPMNGTYTRLDRPRALDFDVHDHCVADLPDGVDPPNRDSRVEVRFKPVGRKTEISISQIGLTPAYQLLAEVGWRESITRLGRALHIINQSGERSRDAN